MSDYIPNPPDPRPDPHNRYSRNYDSYYEPSGGRGLTLVVGVLVAIALVAGLMFFTTGPRDRNDQAQLPVQDRTMTAPATAPTDQTRMPAIPLPRTPPAAAPAAPQQ
jgi:hypothetical protein